jgi:RNA polymerase sigma-70 factor, ECF subfamily
MIVLVLPDIATEDNLLDRMRRGDDSALHEIYQHYFSAIFQFIRLRVATIQEAEDLAGDVFLELIVAVRRAKVPRKSLRGWLFRVARNQLYDRYSRKPKFTETALDEWIPTAETENPETKILSQMNVEEARRAIQQLVSEQQEVIILRFGHKLSLQETADIMDKNSGAIKSLQFRALNNLRQLLVRWKVGVDDE